MKLLFAGDFVFSKNEKLELSSKIQNYIKTHDYCLLNFEGAICTAASKPIFKTGPHVSNDGSAIEMIKKMGFNIAALANNHITDFGLEALMNTRQCLNDNEILPVGASCDFNETYEPLLFKNNDKTIAIINACQAEFGVQKDISIKGGYAWINHSLIDEKIKECVSKGFFTILYVHAGLEGEITVLPEWRQRYHHFIDLGAKYVIGNHPHIIQGIEEYRDGTIFYSLGNFYFRNEDNSLDWNRGLLVSIDTDDLKNNEWFIIQQNNGFIDFFDREESTEIINKRSESLYDEILLNQNADLLAEKCWNDYYKSYYENCICEKDIDDYSIRQIVLYLINRILKKIFQKPFIQKKKHIDETFLLHNIQIETHRWCVERYLFNKNIKKNHFE